MVRMGTAVLLLVGILTTGKIAEANTTCFVESVNVKIERHIDSNCLSDFLRQYLQYSNDLKDASDGGFYRGFFDVEHSQHEAWLQGTDYGDNRLFFQLGNYPQYSHGILLKNGWLQPADMTDGSEWCTLAEQLLCRLVPNTAVQNGELAQIIMQWFYATTENAHTDRVYLTIN